jgi:hypothetical protein
MKRSNLENLYLWCIKPHERACDERKVLVLNSEEQPLHGVSLLRTGVLIYAMLVCTFIERQKHPFFKLISVT